MIASRNADLALTALAPAIWGSTYLVTTELLPPGYPLTVAMLRALPAGLLLLLIVRQLPSGIWWPRTFLLGALNFSFFWAMLFVSAYRLPGGVAATVGAIQPLIVILLSRVFLGSPIRALSIIAGLAGIVGVGLLVLTPGATLDPLGVVAGLAGAVSMAFGTVLSRHWAPPVPPLTFTAWQLAAGGVLLVPVALFFEPALPTLTMANYAGLAYLGLIGAAFTYLLWFRGLSRLEPSAVAPLGFLSPVVAILLGWGVLDERLTPVQALGILVVLISVWLSQRAQLAPRVRPARA
ncbi:MULTISPECIES: EamA family transporter [Ensifer]|jgi:probable blue pigment (indigoidine) exporter|uniref:EamA family transporter n=1 Tax=Ensifer TaxID=106591 RepID=UPI00042ECA26|nr:putative transmembrane protein [Ensifer adhaerens OV14]KQU98410.1 ABC transporter permease [Ensifer sp. Root31]KQW63169.1 ABC transporter permease [Ensifer sp. Root1252]KQW85185.1 ABC transporter permease [Ensifer sp. Root127]KQY71055.1 ABC transporter permease [Ensifer sp. Root142]KRC83989.1 ABC transporter permease [Ensifer sp. Root231]KRD04343.1 ABC transporter permease [Ensifer sp. Root258]MDP9628792.1 putative blue pigment (indigoidine) exporter [Ensifer adhaerens]OMQ45014.1 EamA fa